MKASLRHRLRLPTTRWKRIALGWALVAGGLLGFMPVLGFWMLPLGLAVLSVDVPYVRRRRRRLSVWWARRNGRRPAAMRNAFRATGKAPDAEAL